MLNPSFRELEKISKSRYDIAMMTAKRAKEIIDGDNPLVETKAKKPVTIAIEEIMAGKIVKEDERGE